MAAILEATAQVLEADGYEGTTTGKIAERAGVSVGSLYQYFPTKDALVAELVERHFTEVSERMLTVLAEVAAVPIDDAVGAIAEAIVELHRERAVRHQAFNLLLLRLDGVEIIDRFLSSVEAAVTDTLARRTEALRVSDPELAAQVLCRAVSGLVRNTLRREPERFADEAFRRELVELVRRYLV